MRAHGFRAAVNPMYELALQLFAFRWTVFNSNLFFTFDRIVARPHCMGHGAGQIPVARDPSRLDRLTFPSTLLYAVFRRALCTSLPLSSCDLFLFVIWFHAGNPLIDLPPGRW